MNDEPRNWAWTAHVEPLVQEILDLLGRRRGRLAAVCVTAPPEASSAAVAKALASRLSEWTSTRDIELQVVVVPGPMRILSAEFDQ